MLQYTLTNNINKNLIEQTLMAINANCAWLEIDPDITTEENLNQIIDLCRTNEIILVFKHLDLLLEQKRVHGIHLGANDANPIELRNRLGGHPIIGVDMHTDTQLQTLKQADVDYIVLENYPTATTTEIVNSLREKEQKENILIPIVVSGHITCNDIQTLIDNGASGINIDINSLQGPDYGASLSQFITVCNNVVK